MFIINVERNTMSPLVIAGIKKFGHNLYIYAVRIIIPIKLNNK